MKIIKNEYERVDALNKVVKGKIFFSYFIVGILATIVHWGAFMIGVIILSASQAFSNAVGFILASIVGFFMNSHFTFSVKPTIFRYSMYAVTMGSTSWTIGKIADAFSIYPLFTVIASSAVSLFVGYLISKNIIFK